VIVVGQHWQTGPWRSTPREIVIDTVLDGDEIGFHFLDREQISSATLTAFLRTYVEVPS
jgi:hypothetical protein